MSLEAALLMSSPSLLIRVAALVRAAGCEPGVPVVLLSPNVLAFRNSV
ncbi:MAG TPA: hypothetical protein VNG12_18345 [Acidimicrobiales bacterium]|nr:hypothetical protein [Acidimicrobiales bacterium]